MRKDARTLLILSDRSFNPLLHIFPTYYFNYKILNQNTGLGCQDKIRGILIARNFDTQEILNALNL